MRRLLIASLLAAGVSVGMVAADGPLTPLMNLQGRTDANGYLMTTAGTYASPDGPLTPLSNLRGRTDANGYLMTTSSGGAVTGSSLTATQGTLTADAQALSTTATWNNAAVNFTHWKAVITDTASGASSKAINILGGAAGATTLFSVSNTGAVVTGAGINMGGSSFVPSASYFGWGSNGWMGASADGVHTLYNNTLTDETRLTLGGITDSFPGIGRSGAGLVAVLAGGGGNTTMTASSFLPSGAQITSGSATGLTVSSAGATQDTTYKIVADRTAFVCAATTCDLTIGTLPANTWLVQATASLTQVFACSATCTTATLSMVLGKGAGGAEYLASLDADAATAIFGDADAEMGSLMTRAAAIQGGTFTSGSQAVVLRLTSGTGFVGNGAATNLSTGSITIWVTTRRLQ